MGPALTVRLLWDAARVKLPRFPKSTIKHPPGICSRDMSVRIRDEKARTSHNGNSRKFAVSGQCPRRQRRGASSSPGHADSAEMSCMARAPLIYPHEEAVLAHLLGRVPCGLPAFPRVCWFDPTLSEPNRWSGWLQPECVVLCVVHVDTCPILGPTGQVGF